MVVLENNYFKRDVKCSLTENRKTCCRRIFKCSIKDKKHNCVFLKNQKCVIKIIDIPLPKKPSVCVSSGDPHYKTFSGKRFDNYRVGDFLLLESAGFTIHTRLRNWHSVSVNTGFAARVNKAGETVESESRSGLHYLINGKQRLTLKHKEKYFF